MAGGDLLVPPNVIKSSEPDDYSVSIALFDDDDNATSPSLKEQSKIRTCAKGCLKELILVLTVIGVLLGIAIGLILRLTNPSEDAIMLVSLPGDLLMRMLKMLIIPLIISSLISGVAQLDARASSRMGTWAVLYYITTTALAVITGIITVVAISPGSKTERSKSENVKKNNVKVSTLDSVADILRNLIPENLIQACFQQLKTTYDTEIITSPPTNVSAFNSTTNETRYFVQTFDQEKVTKAVAYSNGTNVLGLIAFCIAFGVVLSKRANAAKNIIDFFVSLNDVVMHLVNIIMWYSPFGIMSLIAGKLMGISNLGQVAQQLGLYMVTVTTGLILHAVITLPGIYFMVTRRNPFTFFQGMLTAWMTALGTASSAATLPVTFRCLEDNLNVDQRVTRFVLPIGATVNMDGTALYEAVAAIFIAQLHNINFGIGKIVTVSLTATLASIGAASVPGAGLVTMLLVLTAVGLPSDDIMLIYTVDWLLDRLRTSINVLGDAFGAGVVAHLVRSDLSNQDQRVQQYKCSVRQKKMQKLERIIDNRASIIVREPRRTGSTSGNSASKNQFAVPALVMATLPQSAHKKTTRSESINGPSSPKVHF